MKKWFLVAAVIGWVGQAGAATVSGLYTQPTALTPTHLTIDASADWASITFSISSAQPFENIFSSFRPKTSPLANFSASGAALFYGIGGITIEARAPNHIPTTSFTWTIRADRSIFPDVEGGYFIGACWFGNELCNNAKISFWAADRARTHFEFDVWSSPGQVPLPATAPLLGSVVAALGYWRGRRRAM